MERITKAEELDALPVGSVVVNPFGNSEFHKTRTGRWIDSDGSRWLSSEMTQDEQEYNLYRPDAPTPPVTHRYTPEQRHAAEQDEALRRIAERALFGTGEVIDIVLRALGDAPTPPAEDREVLVIGHDAMYEAIEDSPNLDEQAKSEVLTLVDHLAARQPAPVDAETVRKQALYDALDAIERVASWSASESTALTHAGDAVRALIREVGESRG